jgi:hypothetical protein
MIMTKATQPLTIEDMNEILYTRAEEVFLLCMLITRRGLAHAFCDFSAHVSLFTSHVRPIDSEYTGGKFTEIAKISTWTDMSNQAFPESTFEKYLAEMDTYISYLDYIIEKGEPITTSDQAA